MGCNRREFLAASGAALTGMALSGAAPANVPSAAPLAETPLLLQSRFARQIDRLLKGIYEPSGEVTEWYLSGDPTILLRSRAAYRGPDGARDGYIIETPSGKLLAFVERQQEIRQRVIDLLVQRVVPVGPKKPLVWE